MNRGNRPLGILGFATSYHIGRQRPSLSAAQAPDSRWLQSLKTGLAPRAATHETTAISMPR
jgi:hypothetical protein